MFQTKVVGFKKVYLLILSVWPWVASSDQGYIDFKKWKSPFFIVYICS